MKFYLNGGKILSYFTIMLLAIFLFSNCRNFGSITAMTLLFAPFASTTEARANAILVAYAKMPLFTWTVINVLVFYCIQLQTLQFQLKLLLITHHDSFNRKGVSLAILYTYHDILEYIDHDQLKYYF